jgi:hypothetical protein
LKFIGGGICFSSMKAWHMAMPRLKSMIIMF